MTDLAFFNKHYNQYIGNNLEEISTRVYLSKCDRRDQPICTWYFHKVICTVDDEKTIFSIGPEFYETFKIFIKDKYDDLRSLEGCHTVINNFSNKYKIDAKTSKMYRLSIFDEIDITGNKSHVLTKKIILNAHKAISDDALHNLLERKKDELDTGRQCVILDGENIVSWAKISDIDFDGANIAVWTSADKRKFGYGKEVVMRLSHWCQKNNFVPIYLVDVENLASLNLAKSLGFQVLKEEVILRTEV